MMSAPGLHRDVTLDLAELCDVHRCAVLVSLVSDQELEYLRIVDLLERAHRYGIELIRFSIGDDSTPDSLDGVIVLVREILAVVQSGRTVVVHCWAGLGRTGLVVACCLVGCGVGPADAIDAVRQCRPRAIEYSDQEDCVAGFARAWQQARQ